MSLLPPKEVKKVPSPYIIDPFIIVASSASAISARLLSHPLDTIRIRIQTCNGPLPPWKVLIPKPRLQVLYAGLPVALGVSIPALSIYLCSYEFTKKYLGSKLLPQDTKPTLLQQIPIFMLSGMAAEISSGALWTVSDVLKGRLQKGDDGNISATKLLRKIWKEEGRLGVFRGYLVSMVVFIPYISLYWTLYESFKTGFVHDYDPYRPSSAIQSPILSNTTFNIPLTLQYTLCSVTACSLAASVTTPIELVQARWQTSAGKVKNGVIGIVKDLYKQGGIKAFSRGLGIRIAYAIPANGISMTVYESLKRYKGI